MPYDAPFNFSAKINLGVEHATGDLLLLLNDDTELIEPASVEVLVGHLQMPDVAMAGAKLLFADGTLQHGGHVYSGQPNHVCVGWRGDSPGPWPLRPLAVERECSGVTAACALVRKAAFTRSAGFPPSCRSATTTSTSPSSSVGPATASCGRRGRCGTTSRAAPATVGCSPRSGRGSMPAGLSS